MFVWETIKTPGTLTLYRRNQIMRSIFEEIVDDIDERIYDAITNEWDFFPGFVKDPDGQADDGVPAFVPAPPILHTPFDHHDTNGHTNNEENQLVRYIRSSDGGTHPMVRDTTFPSGRISQASHQAANVDEEGELVEDNPDVSHDMEETLCFMYGWKRTHGYETLPRLAKILNWRGIEKILGFSSTPAVQEVEKLAITAFVTILSMGPSAAPETPNPS